MKSGEWTKDQAFAEFLETFDSPKNLDGEVCNKHHNSGIAIVENEIDHSSRSGSSKCRIGSQ